MRGKDENEWQCWKQMTIPDIQIGVHTNSEIYHDGNQERDAGEPLRIEAAREHGESGWRKHKYRNGRLYQERYRNIKPRAARRNGAKQITRSAPVNFSLQSPQPF